MKPVFLSKDKLYLRYAHSSVRLDFVILLTVDILYAKDVIQLGHRGILVCLVHIKPFFLPVDTQHTQCPCRFFLLETEALWSQNHDTEILLCNAASRVDYAMTWHRAGYDRCGIQTLATQMCFPPTAIFRSSQPSYWSLSCDYGLHCSHEFMCEQQ